MEELVKLLDEYGLEMGLFNEEDKEKIQYNTELIKNVEQQKNAFEGFLSNAWLMKIKVRDYEKFYTKMCLPEELNFIGEVVQKYIHIEIIENYNKRLESYFWSRADLHKEMRRDFNRLVREDPEKVGIETKEFEIKKVFGPDDVIKTEVQKLMERKSFLMENEVIKEKLIKVALEIKELLEDEPYNQQWYIDYVREKTKREMLNR